MFIFLISSSPFFLLSESFVFVSFCTQVSYYTQEETPLYGFIVLFPEKIQLISGANCNLFILFSSLVSFLLIHTEVCQQGQLQ